MPVTDHERARRATFGRGVAEGLRLAGVPNPGILMNNAKLARLESGLNTMARKVLEAVPMQQPWHKDQIVAEMRRTGSNAGRDVIEGCLATLTARGLAKEQPRAHFIRAAARPPAPPQPADPIMQANPSTPSATSAATPAPDTLGRLANLGVLLRRAAEECDAIALEVEERVQAAGEDGDKLRQLQALLKSIGV